MSRTPGSRLGRRPAIALLSLVLTAAGLCYVVARPPAAHAASVVTVTNTNDSGPGSLRQAILSAANGDTINFDTSGVFATPQIITLTSGELFVNKSLTIDGPGASQLTVSGNNASRVFFVKTGNTVTLDGLTVSGGNGLGAYPSVDISVGIVKADGGGIYNEGALTVTNCTVSGNSSDLNGGGIAIRSDSSGTLTLTNSTVSGNSALLNGGGVHNTAGTVTITNSTISNNSGFYTGGGILNIDAGTVTVTNSTVSGNIAETPFDGGLGGGIINFDGTLTVTNSTISGNSASTYGGGIVNGGTLTVTNCTVTGNRADSDGDAFGSGGGITPAGTETLINTIVAGNFVGTGSTPDDIITTFGTIETANNNLIGDAATSGGITDGVNGNKVGFAVSAVLDPTLANNGGPTQTHALVCDSPAIDAGSNVLALDAFNIALTTDQRGAGFARTADLAVPDAAAGAGIDIGAFELQDADSNGLGDGCDATPPVITPTVTGTLGNNGWYKSDVQVSWSVTDSESTVSNQSGCGPQSITSDTNGVTFTCAATSAGGTSSQSVTVKRDATAPTQNPVVSPNPVQVNGPATATSGAADALSGLASQNCGAVDTSTAGAKSVTCYATDNAGNGNSAAANYTVQSGFSFAGFFAPVDNLPTLNVATAGSALAVKFGLGGYQGLGIFATGYPASSQIPCDANTPGDEIEETVNAGGSSLSYDAATGRYGYVWKTDKAWKGTCRLLIVRLSDGTDHFAKFRFK